MTTRWKRLGQLATAAVAAATFAPLLPSAPAGAIVGGVAVSPSVYPQYVRIVTNKNQCGGTVIATDTVLTAGHCIHSDVPIGYYSVYIGDVNPVGVSSITVHPLWNGDFAHGHDLAILRLVPGSTAGVPTIQVGAPFNPEYYAANRPAAIVGHGATSPDGPATYELRAVDTILRSDSDMSDIYDPWYWLTNWNSSLMIGAGTRTPLQTACEGDSGGPVVVDKDGTWNWIEVGVGSFVQTWPHKCGEPAVFTELSGAQLAWVATQEPSIMSKWGPCTAPDGRAGTPMSNYGSIAGGSGTDGPFGWTLMCWAPPPTPTPDPGDGGGPLPPICRKQPWKCHEP